MSDEGSETITTLPFPPVTAAHILNCSFHSWHPLFRPLTPKARLIPLSPPFLEYLRADGILLPPDNSPNDADSGFEDEEEEDPSEPWSDIHERIRSTIYELGGKVVPKLNWSAPKDATWMATTNDMECRTPNDIYLLLKSSDFVTHDLEQAFDGCIDQAEIPYHLVLRKSFNLNPSLEFRCFVRKRKLIAISQREMNYFEFLFELRQSFKAKIQDFLERLSDFPDANFVFDVYIPPPHDRVWLIDINPWAPRTDPLLFSWLEILQIPEPEKDTIFDPEFRLVQRDDPEAYQFATTKYSAHKLPKEVVDASMAPSEMKNMMEEWKRVMEKQVDEDSEDSEDSVT
ncbi:cell division cycle protein 123 [Capronia epimyces CBS 606.96]|uniref:Cell division cycle protein 123 n=1 Tax=Capronia epimyces CBS 606.96 TaxID=1182542 RepID=W9YEA1_9EURO|nr:cell division cycle protein 123 [Capronia epimyces CBS 606.96]EXJ87601.1 cell division cycle protein 123 [Capronia epimyces CBS 606.96]